MNQGADHERKIICPPESPTILVFEVIEDRRLALMDEFEVKLWRQQSVIILENAAAPPDDLPFDRIAQLGLDRRDEDEIS